jgi:hypothetical protein
MRETPNSRIDRLKADVGDRLKKYVLAPLLTVPFLGIDIQFFRLLKSTYPATAGPMVDALHTTSIVALAFLMAMGISTVLEKDSSRRIFVVLASVASIVMILIGSTTLWIQSNGTFFAIEPAEINGIYVGIAACIIYLLAARQWFCARTNEKTNPFK